MALIKCNECGKEISDRADKCPNCGCPVHTGKTDRYSQFYQKEVPTMQQNISTNYPQYNPSPKQAPQKNSSLGIIALVLSILGCTFLLGAILAIVDLCKKDGSKKTCSKIALIICAIWVVLSIIFGTSSNQKIEGTAVNKTIQETVPITDAPAASVEAQETNTNEIITPQATDDSVATVGDTVEGNTWKITLLDTKLYDEIAGDYYTDTPNDGKKYLVLFFEVENISDKDDYFNYLYIESYLDGYNTDSAITLNSPEGYGELTGDVAAGKKLKGCIKYEVDQGWQELEVSYKNWIATSKKTATFVVTPENVN